MRPRTPGTTAVSAPVNVGSTTCKLTARRKRLTHRHVVKQFDALPVINQIRQRVEFVTDADVIPADAKTIVPLVRVEDCCRQLRSSKLHLIGLGFPSEIPSFGKQTPAALIVAGVLP